MLTSAGVLESPVSVIRTHIEKWGTKTSVWRIIFTEKETVQTMLDSDCSPKKFSSNFDFLWKTYALIQRNVSLQNF